MLFKLTLILMVIIATLSIASQSQAHTVNSIYPRQIPSPFTNNYAGTDWPSPEAGYMACSGYWTWTQSCYTAVGSAGVTMHQKLVADTTFIIANHLGHFQRIWVSLDQMFAQPITSGYIGLSTTSLINFDDAMGIMANAGISLDLVLYNNSNTNGFQVQAIDGNHTNMATGYVQALTDFMAHVKGNVVDSKVVKIVDVFNEGYYQLDQWYDNPTTRANLGIWNYLEPANNVCDNLGNVICDAAHAGSDGHGCVNPGGNPDQTCINVNMAYPFFARLINAVHAIDPNVLVTLSTACCNEGPLSFATDNPYTTQAFFESMYPNIDIYDLHLYAGTSTANPPYSDGPWSLPVVQNLRAAGINGVNLNHPWFSGETGCGGGDIACTYFGDNPITQEVDQYWLNVAWEYGDKMTMIEQGADTTVWTNPNSDIVTYHLTAVGAEIAIANIHHPR